MAELLDPTEVRRGYDVPEAIRLRVDQRGASREITAWIDGADEAVREVATRPDDLEAFAGRGRGALSRVSDTPLGPVVVREYRKGGLLRGVRGRRFHGRYRPLDELVLHRRLLAARVPVAPAVGAVVLAGPFGWRGFFLSCEVGQGLDLETYLYDPASHPEWSVREVLAAAGASVRALHDAGVSHADLHLKNLLLDPSTAGVLVIDLDRSRAAAGPLSEEERLENLTRLARAVEKHRMRGLDVGRRAARRFLGAYAGDAASGDRWLDRIRDRLKSGLPARRLWWRLSGQAGSRAGAPS